MATPGPLNGGPLASPCDGPCELSSSPGPPGPPFVGPPGPPQPPKDD